MKIKFLAIGGLALALTACGGSSDKPLSEYSNADEADSLSFYLGEVYAQNYVQQMKRDSALSNNKEYLKGFEAGLAALGESAAYNEGFTTGLQLASGMKQFAEQSNLTLSAKMIINGFNYALVGDTVRDDKAQENFLRLNEKIITRAEAERKAEAEKALSAAASKAGFKKNALGLYTKVLKAGNGTELNLGDKFNYTVKVTGPDGKEIKPLCVTDEEAVLGRTLPVGFVLGRFVKGMKAGETAEMLVSANELLQGNPQTIGLKPNDVITVNVSVGTTVSKDSQEVSQAAPAAEAAQK